MPRVSSKSLPAGLIGLWVPLLALLLQACTNKPLGQELANSFDTPPEQPAQVSPVDSDSDAPEPSAESRAPAKERTKPDDSSSKNSPEVEQKPGFTAAPVTPQPYRITIKLSGADPSAPAEAVTQALRRAGVNFEVETIERVQAQSSNTVSPSDMGEKP